MSDDIFYVSVSSMKEFFSCHKQYYWRQRLSSKPEYEPSFFRDGTDAHAAMEGKIPDKMSMAAMNYYSKLQTLVARYGYDLHEKEVYQKVEILPGVVLVRIIDAIASWNGDPLLIDYKTANQQWKTIGDSENMAKGMTFQAPAYLIPPDNESDWPDELHFLVAPSRGAPQRFVYRWNEEAEENFFNAVRFMKANRDSQIMNRGIGCDYCGYAAACYGIDGWENMYEIKGDRK